MPLLSRDFAGPALTLLLIVLMEALSRFGVFRIPNPGSFVLIAIVYAGYSGGVRAAAISTVLGMSYAAYFFSDPGSLNFSGDNAGRMLVLAAAAPFLAWVTGTLKDRSERLLAGQLALERAQVAELAEHERRLLASETQLRTVLDGLPAAVAYVDRDLRIRLHNRLYEKWSGQAPGKIDGASVEAILGADRFERELRPQVEKVFAGERVTWESERADADGNRVLAEVTLVPHYANGEVLGYFGMLLDITARKELERRFAKANERLQRALEGSRLVLWELDLASGVVHLGAEWRDIVQGEAPSEMLLTELRELVHPEDLARVDDAFRSVASRQTESYDLEHRIRTLDGAWRWIRSTGRAMGRDALGRPRRIAGTNRDITQRKEAELALEDSRARLRLITDTVPAFIAYLDSEQRFQFCNGRYCDALGLPEEKILGRPYAEVVGPDIHEQSRSWLERTLRGERVEYERTYRFPDGRQGDLAITYVPHRAGESIVGLYLLAVDITERKRGEQIRNRFISMVSHELRTPLTSILGALDTLEEGAAGALPPAAVEITALAMRNAERMLQLADEILDIEKIDQGEMRLRPASVRLAALAENSIALSQPYARRHGVLLAGGKIDDLSVHADPERLSQVLANLLSNAIKHSPKGETVLVEIAAAGSNARVTVSDRGKGVPQEFAERLFGRFEQSDAGREQGGTGLGLAICKEIVERSGGLIGYQPGTQGGAVFYFELPLASSGRAAVTG